MIHSDIQSLASKIPAVGERLRDSGPAIPGICGFDGFIDTFIRLVEPPTMAEFGAMSARAAGILASCTSRHLGDKFGGNGPLFTAALSGALGERAAVTYIGALGDSEVLPIFREALETKTVALHTLADPAHSDCLEFTDGKLMLSDLEPCAAITWERLVERVGAGTLDEMLRRSRFVAAVNWGKLVHAGPLWEKTAVRLGELGVPEKEVSFFMDLAEFQHRPESDREDLFRMVATVTGQCTTTLSLNLKEAWQLADSFGGSFHDQRSPDQVAELAGFLRERVVVDRIVVHPNDGAACATADGTVYVPGPVCSEPLVSVGAGDHFGAGFLAGELSGLDETGMLLSGVATSGHFVRSGHSPSGTEIAALLEGWLEGRLPERITAAADN